MIYTITEEMVSEYEDNTPFTMKMRSPIADECQRNLSGMEKKWAYRARHYLSNCDATGILRVKNL